MYVMLYTINLLVRYLNAYVVWERKTMYPSYDGVVMVVMATAPQN